MIEFGSAVLTESSAPVAHVGPLSLYETVLRRVAAGRQATLEVVGSDGEALDRLDPSHWLGGLRAGDHGVIARCVGATLDVGCGPGRLAAAVSSAGHTALGVDVSTAAVRLARHRGAPAVCQDVFAPLPGEGTWQHVLLADGNIGIGGDPRRLLRRCAALLAPRGDILAELQPPGARTWSGEVALRDGERTSAAFPWAFVPATEIERLAHASALRVSERWTEAGRWFAQLAMG